MVRRKWLVGCSLPAMLLALSTAGRAADIVAPPVHDWSGLYVGGFVGYGDLASNGFFATSLDLGFDGAWPLVGGRVGWNWQADHFVFGVEGDGSFFNSRGDNLREETYTAETEFLGSLRGRVGWADDNVLFYATGGAAYVHADVRTSLGGQDPDQQGNEDRKDNSGWGAVAGAGIEWAVSPNLSLTTEGLFYLFDLRTSLANLTEGLGPGPNDDGVPAGVPGNFFKVGDGFEFRVGANWKLWNPVAEDQGLISAAAAGTLTEEYDWTGFYVGPHVGVGRIDSHGVYRGDRFTNPPLVTPPDLPRPAPIKLSDIDNQGIVGGFQAGYNFQSGPLVFGIEGDFTGLNWDDLMDDLKLTAEPNPISLNVNFMATGQLRAGLAAGNLLGYVTGGLAFLDAEFVDHLTNSSKDVSTMGAVVGGGVEWGYRPDLTFRAEALFLDFFDDTSLSDLPNGDKGDFARLDEGLVVRLGANWRPGQPSGAVQAAGLVQDGGYDWGGLYVGANFGWGAPNTKGMYNSDPEPDKSIDLRDVSDFGILGGGQVGVNWQFGSYVFGIEGDVAAVDWDHSPSKFWIPEDTMTLDTDLLATMRARAGYADDNLLFYVTGGAAWLTADLSLDEKSEDAKFGPKDMSVFGGVAGLGMEWGITDALSVKTEGLVMFFNEFDSLEKFGENGEPGDFVSLDDAFVFRLGVNWRLVPFGGAISSGG